MTPHHFSRKKFNQIKPTKSGGGFTLIELVVVTSIIVLITALILPNYRAGDQQLSLQRAVHKLTQDLRRAQEMALSSQEFDNQTPAGYGIYFDKNQPTKYILFADIDGDGQYFNPDPEEMVEEITLEGQAIISDLSPETLSTLNIVFVPPDPDVSFYPDADSASITIKTEEEKTVQINKAGLIYIE